ncbi:MAG TPA: hypothetical protein VHH72_11190 [Solirubrobacterales bacterium]|jgi:hypothetical protein|nr:hypothetical protein [Solirubrobacterales bacterium]
MQGIAAIALLAALAAVLAAQLLPDGRADAAPVAEAAKKKKNYSVTSKSFRISRPNDGQRLTVLCPGKAEPLGGGMTTDPPDADGEGIYPHSYERLGRQSGYHISVILYDPSPAQTKTRTVTLQVQCGPKYGKVSPPHDILDLGPTDRKVAVAKCPGRRFLIGGGYQRTNFTNQGGILATESRAISAKSWQVSSVGLGKFGGQSVAIGYCVRTKKPPLQTVTETVPVPPRGFAVATTPPCPKKRELAFGGFSTPADGAVLSTGGSFKSNGSWTVGGYNTSGTDASVTAYGYCLRV